jgi:O-antigen ligase
MTAHTLQPTGALSPGTGVGRDDHTRLSLLPWTLFLVVHGPIAIAIRQSPMLATAHALGTLLVGIWWASTSRIESVAYVGAYVAAAEVLWRMSRFQLPWEFGKYATCIIFVASIVRSRSARLPILPLAYFALQLPSIGLVISNPDLHYLRSNLSFYLSGPLSLTVIALFYARLGLSRAEVTRLFLTFLGPVTGIASVALFRIATSASLHLAGGSNVVTSGGFGPNQVSAVLGLGSLMAVLCAMTAGRNLLLKGFMLGLSLVLAGQSVLTFSRTGLYCACGSLLAASFCAVRDPRIALRMAAVLGVTASVFYFAVFPFLVDYTKGGIAKRFADTGTTGRDQLMVADLELWAANPIFGVGPGASEDVHVLHHGMAVASHSELTRLLAEHGVFGLIALMLLLGMGCRNCMRAPAGLSRSIAVSLTTWSLLYVFSNGMRLVMPSFVFGLSFCKFIQNWDGRGAR